MSEERGGPGRGFRIMIWGIVGLQMALLAALQVVTIWMAPYARNLQETLPSTLLGSLSILVYPAVGLVIFTRRPAHPIGWLFCLSQIGWAFNNFANGFGLFALRAHPDLLPIARWVVWFYTWPGYLSMALFLFLILLFPTGRLPSPRWKPVAWLIVAWAGACVLISAFAPGAVDSSGGLPYSNPLGAHGSLGSLLASLNNGVQVFLAPLVALSALSLILRYRSANGQTRQQLKWLAFSVALIAVMVSVAMVLLTVYPLEATNPLWVTVLEQLSILSMTLIPVAAGIAILRYRLYEIDRIINQALVYSSLTIALALVYFGCVVILQTVLGVITGEGHSTIATVLSTLAIASLFIPLRRRIQSVIDRRFYRQKYNTEIILSRFSSVLRNEVDLQLMSDQLVAVVEDALQPRKASLWIARKEDH